MSKHPMQSIEKDDYGVYRFKQNEIINWLFETGKINFNEIVLMPFSVEDRTQLAQLLGYSVYGFCDLSYVLEEAKDEADNKVLSQLSEQDKKQNGFSRYISITDKNGDVRSIEDIEAEMIQLAMKKYSMSDAAQKLGIGRSTLYRKMAKQCISTE